MAHALMPIRDLIAGFAWPDALRSYVAQVRTGLRQPLVAVNPLSFPDAGVVVLPESREAIGSVRDAHGRTISPLQPLADGRLLARLTDVPPLGHALFELAQTPAALNPVEQVVASASPAGAVLENRLLRAEFDAHGRLSRLYDKLDARELLAAPGQGPPSAPLAVAESGPLRATLASPRWRYALEAESRRLDVAFADAADIALPFDLRCHHATYATAEGYIEKPTDPEPEPVAALWSDLTEPFYGVAILHAPPHAWHGGTLRLQIPAGWQWSLLPHPGDPLHAGVIHQALRREKPLIVASPEPPPATPGPLPPRFAAITTDSPNLLITPELAGRPQPRLRLHLRECFGGRGRATVALHFPVPGPRTFPVAFTPFSTHTLEVPLG